MKGLSRIVALAFLMPGCSFAAVASQPLPAATSPLECAPANCRTAPTHVRLQAENGGEYEATFNRSPYVYNGTIIIYPGETLVFHFADSGDVPGNPVFDRAEIANQVAQVPPSDNSFTATPSTSVQHDPNTGENLYEIKKGSPFAPSELAVDHLKNEPPGTLIVSYYQVSGHTDMVLRIEHNFPNPLKMDAQIDRLRNGNSTGLQYSSTCPARPSLAHMETWPYPIGTITLSNFRFVDTSAGINCD